MADATILAMIKAAGERGLTLESIAHRMACTRQAAYESVWRLRGLGFVHREGSTRDARWVADDG